MEKKLYFYFILQFMIYFIFLLLITAQIVSNYMILLSNRISLLIVPVFSKLKVKIQRNSKRKQKYMVFFRKIDFNSFGIFNIYMFYFWIFSILFASVYEWYTALLKYQA